MKPTFRDSPEHLRGKRIVLTSGSTRGKSLLIPGAAENLLSVARRKGTHGQCTDDLQPLGVRPGDNAIVLQAAEYEVILDDAFPNPNTLAFTASYSGDHSYMGLAQRLFAYAVASRRAATTRGLTGIGLPGFSSSLPVDGRRGRSAVTRRGLDVSSGLTVLENIFWLRLDPMLRILIGIPLGGFIAHKPGRVGYGEYLPALSFVVIFGVIAVMGLNVILTRSVAQQPEEA